MSRARIRGIPGRLGLLYLAALILSFLLLHRSPPPPGQTAAGLDEPAVPALAGGGSGAGRGSAPAPVSGWVEGVLRLGLPLLDVYTPGPLFEWNGVEPLLARLADGGLRVSLGLLQAQMPVLALEDPEPGLTGGPAGAEWSPLPLPYVARDGASAEVTPSRPLPPPARPLVIVYQTHAHESFIPALRAAGLPTDSPYTADERVNIVRVGEEVARTLQEEHGIPTLHLRTPFDAGGLTGAYMESEKGLRAALARYPTARVLLDVHRDSSGREATVTVVGGQPVARVMFVVGQGNRHLPNPHWQANQAFGRAIARALDTAVRPDPLPLASAGQPGQRFPPLVRQLADEDGDPWTFGRDGRFNQHLSERAILIEIGGPENTLAEELRAARLVARAVAAALQ